jgi:hypothetical protein
LQDPDEAFRGLAKWVATTGCVEIGIQGSGEFSVTVKDNRGTLLEEKETTTLSEALFSLEQFFRSAPRENP